MMFNTKIYFVKNLKHVQNHWDAFWNRESGNRARLRWIIYMYCCNLQLTYKQTYICLSFRILFKNLQSLFISNF